MNFDEIAVQMLSFSEKSLGQGATEEEITAAATVLGVPIRGGYKKFLKQFGWGGVADFDIFGLGAGVPEHLNLIRVMTSERTEMQPPLPRHLLPLMNDGGGNLYCVDTTKNGDPPIVVWYHDAGADQEPEQEAADFTTWLKQLIDSRIDDGSIVIPTH